MILNFATNGLRVLAHYTGIWKDNRQRIISKGIMVWKNRENGCQMDYGANKGILFYNIAI